MPVREFKRPDGGTGEELRQRRFGLLPPVDGPGQHQPADRRLRPSVERQESAPATDLDVVGMGADTEDVEPAARRCQVDHEATARR
jgi:hypothetical protein